MKKKNFLWLILTLCLSFVMSVCFVACDDPAGQTPGGGGGGGNTPAGEEDHYVTAFEITQNPTKLNYVEGEPFDLTGIDVKITWEDGVIWTLSGGDITLSDLTVKPKVMAADTTKIEVIFDEYSKEIDINGVNVKSLVVERTPAKMSYKVGDTFNPSGMIIKGETDGGTSIVIDDYDYAPKGALTANDTKVTITYRDVSVDLPITVSANSFYMEAEDCTLTDGGSGKMALKSQGSAAGHDLLAKASGGDFVTDAMPKDSISFKVTAETAGTATLKLTASSNATVVGTGTQSEPSTCLDRQVNKVYKISVNGTDITIGDDVVLEGVEIPGGSRETWVYWRIVDLGKINLQQGENTITLTVISGGGYTHSYKGAAYGQIDAFEVIFD